MSNLLQIMLGGECDEEFCEFVMNGLMDFQPEEWHFDTEATAPNFETGYGRVTFDEVKSKILAQIEE